MGGVLVMTGYGALCILRSFISFRDYIRMSRTVASWV
jgi:hypothetical protein